MVPPICTSLGRARSVLPTGPPYHRSALGTASVIGLFNGGGSAYEAAQDATLIMPPLCSGFDEHATCIWEDGAGPNLPLIYRYRAILWIFEFSRMAHGSGLHTHMNGAYRHIQRVGPQEIARETIASFVRTQTALAAAVRSRLDVNGAVQRMQALALTKLPSYEDVEPFSPFLAQQVALCLNNHSSCSAAEGQDLAVPPTQAVSVDFAVGASCTLFLLPATVCAVPRLASHSA